jgi:hypothetical protein
MSSKVLINHSDNHHECNLDISYYTQYGCYSWCGNSDSSGYVMSKKQALNGWDSPEFGTMICININLCKVLYDQIDNIEIRPTGNSYGCMQYIRPGTKSMNNIMFLN